jgi:hypothetical protein
MHNLFATLNKSMGYPFKLQGVFYYLISNLWEIRTKNSEQHAAVGKAFAKFLVNVILMIKSDASSLWKE